MVRVGLDNPVNTIDNVTSYVRKTTNEIVNSSYDDIDNVLPNDVVDITSDKNNQQPQKQPKTLKDRTANFWKFFATANQMVKSSLKGILYGALTGLGVLSGSWLFNSLPKAFSKEGPTLKNTLRHPLKHIPKSGKIMAGIGTGAVLAYQIVKGKLTANQKTAVIDHKMKTGHRDK